LPIGDSDNKAQRATTVFKLTTDRGRGNGVTLRLEGRLAAAWVDEFARALGAARNEGAQVNIDLDGLSFVDAQGVTLLRDAIQTGARLVGGSQFISALIDQERPL
jgi:anti-anti-sigma regulatory factor